jgi:hypothetical protein
LKITTAKTAAQALNWIDTTPHHYAAVDEEQGYFILKGYGNKLRIPDTIHKEMLDDVKPGPYLDARMYVLTAKGRRKLNRANKLDNTGKHK